MKQIDGEWQTVDKEAIKYADAKIPELQIRQIDTLPVIPKPFKEWNLTVRPTIEGRENYLKFLPMYQRLYEDEWNWIMIKFARQMGKTTYHASRLGHKSTTIPNSRSTFVTHEDEALSVFSIEKFREALWSESPIARQYVKGSTYGAISHVQTKINAMIRMVTHAHNFKHVEGKSVDLLAFDEGHHLDLEQWVKAKEAQSFTQGEFIITGIGGIVGTEYTKWWGSTDQRKWFFKNEYWRKKLEFRKSGTNRLVYGDYMLDICDGYWRAQESKNGLRHGYYLSQLDAPWVPLKIVDATELYHVSHEYSIEFKRQDYSQVDFRQHVLAEDVEGELKPFTEDLMFKLLDRNLSFVPTDEVDHSLGDVYVGADWGGGLKTVVWVWQCLDDTIPLFRLLFAVRLEGQNADEQFQTVRDIIDGYQAKQAVVDAGGGTHQVEQLQRYFGPRCIKNFYFRRPGRPLPNKKEFRRLKKENIYEIDKTYSLDAVHDLVKVPFSKDGAIMPRIILPAKDYSLIDWIIKQFCYEEVELVKLSTSGQPYRRYFTSDPKLKPDDALQACNYARIAWIIARDKAIGHYGGAIGEVTEYDDFSL